MKNILPLFLLLLCLSCTKSKREATPNPPESNPPELPKEASYQLKESLLLPDSGSTKNATLLDGQWTIRYITGETLIYNPNAIIISNSGSEIAARAGCNYMLVRFNILNDKLQPFYTQMSALGCLGKVDNDRGLWDAMRKFRSFSVSTSGVWLKDSLGNVLVFAQRQ
ncbi:hypothetical protein [Niabella sp.]|uniref:META domain-containing protein n=1 Tax=Niabella sp. TaxID=1962976 RepID=UPI002625F99A|nr:hypothetical protein [Niabella sp.]